MMSFSSAIGRPKALAAVFFVGLAFFLWAAPCFGQEVEFGDVPPPPRPRPLSPTTLPAIPTTLPALSDSDLVLLKKLESGSWRDRRVAEEQLKNLDDSVTGDNQAELTLRAMLAQTKSPEAHARLSAALSALAENRLIGPSLITLHLTDAPSAKVYAELFRQARWPLRTSPDDMLDRDSSILTVDADRRPFWEVFAKLADQGGLALQMYNGQDVALMRGAPMPNGPSDVEGAFMTVATQMTYMHTVALSTNQFRDNLAFSLELMLYAEPKIDVLKLSRQVKVLEAVDDHGNSLKPDGPADDVPQQTSGMPFTLDAPLKFPDKNPGTHLAHFRGEIVATVQTAVQHIEVTDLLNAKPRPLAIGKSIVNFAACRANGDTYTITLTTPLDAQNEWQRIFQEAQQRLHVYDAAGNELDRNGVGDSIDRDLVTITLDMNKGVSPDGKPQGAPAKLVWEVSTATRDITIPIEFKNLDMNIVGGQ
jgi:hypothetical protein